MNKDNTATSKNRQKKEQLVAEVTDKVQRSKGLVFTNYQGLTHQQLEGFKKELRKVNAEYAVIKNTLMKISLKDKNLSDENLESFQQPTGTLFMYEDVVLPLKALTKAIKDFTRPSIKFGIIEDKSYSEADVVKLSTLPPMDVLRAQLLGMMNGPIQGLHRALNWNIMNLVMTLSAIAEKKS